MEVLPGKHRLELIFVSTDRHGIEIDYVALDVADELQVSFVLDSVFSVSLVAKLTDQSKLVLQNRNCE